MMEENRSSTRQEVIQGEVLKFIEQQQENPFFLFVPMVLPHAELVVPEDSIIQKFRGRFPETPYVGVDAKTAFEKGGYRSQEHPRATHAAMVTQHRPLRGSDYRQAQGDRCSREHFDRFHQR